MQKARTVRSACISRRQITKNTARKIQAGSLNYTSWAALFSSIWYVCARKNPYAFHPVSQTFPPTLPLKRFQCPSDCRWPSLVLSGNIVWHFLLHASLLQAIDGVMFLALCPKVVSQAPQHFRSSEKQATCVGCFCLLYTSPSPRDFG